MKEHKQFKIQEAIKLASFPALVNTLIISVSTQKSSAYTLHPIIYVYFFFLLFLQLFADAINNRARKVINELAFAQTLGCIFIFVSLTILDNSILMLFSGPISWGVVGIYLQITRGNIKGLAFHVVWGCLLAGIGSFCLPYLPGLLVAIIFLMYENYTVWNQQQIEN